MLTTPHADEHEQAETLRVRLAEAEEMLRAIRHGEIDALVVEGGDGSQVYTLHSADEPYRNLVEQMQSGALVLTAHGEVLYANAHFAALVGEPLQSVSGQPLRPVRARPGPGRTCVAAGCGAPPPLQAARPSSHFVRGESVAHDDQSCRWRTPQTDCDGHDKSCSRRTANSERAARDSRTKDEFLALPACPTNRESARRDAHGGPGARSRAAPRAARPAAPATLSRGKSTTSPAWSMIWSTSSASSPANSG